MLVLIAAAGAGSRFRNKGLSVPKPLIRVNGRSLLEHTIHSFSFKAGDKLLIAVQRNHGVREELDAHLRHFYPQLKIFWVELDSILPGQLATSTASINYLLQSQTNIIEETLLIHNCDTGFDWNSDLREIENFASMPVFRAEGEHWSFGKPDPENQFQAIAIAEKKRISDLASIGLYGFKSVECFLKAAKNQLDHGSKINNEHYISPMLQAALERGEHVSLPHVKGVKLYGTPEELLKTFGYKWSKLLKENSLVNSSNQ